MKRRIRKVAGAIFLALAIAFSQVPASYVEAINPGADFERDGNTLISYTGTASVVSVPNGIKKISTDAFAGNRFIESVTIPSSVEVIENGAFRDCVRLDEVTFSEGLKTIESGAFSMCPELDTVNFSSTIMDLGAGVFAGDDELSTINLRKNDYFVISDGALYSWDKTKLIQVFAGRTGEHFDMPDSVSSIERYAFWGCDDLVSVELSSHLSEIPEFSFSNCSSLKDISIPYSIRKIGAKAFEDCISLEYITLPVSVTGIHATAFDGCYDLRISAQEGTAAYEFARVFESNQILLMEQEDESVSSNSIGEIYKDVAKSQNEEDETEEDSEKKEDSQKEILDVYNPLNPSDVSKLNVSDYYGPDDSDVIGKSRVVAGNAVVFYDENAASLSEERDVTEDVPVQEEFKADFIAPDDGTHVIAKKEYYQATDFENLTMDGTIEKIDDFAFARSKVKEVVIPEGVTHIGYGAFYHCNDLARVTIPSTVESIEPEAFSKTKYIESWKNGSDTDDFLVVGKGILIAYKGDESRVVLPAGIQKIAGGVFQNHPEITEVLLNESLTEIGEDAFSGCTSLSVISGGKNVKKICDRAFALCPISDLTISSNVEQIGLGAFKLAATDAVVFEASEKLPAVSYEKTATRLENKGLRGLALEGIDVAVVQNTGVTQEHTILDERYMGFRGIVVSIPEPGSNQARLVSCSLYPDEVSGLVEVPSSVRVRGKVYTISGAMPDAFDAYETYTYWGESELRGILLPPSLGKLEDYDVSVNFSTVGTQDENLQEDDKSKDEQESQKEEYVTTIVLDQSYENAQLFSADVLDDDEYYILYVDRGGDDAATLKKAVEDAYGAMVEGQMQVVDLSMTEQSTNVPITNFGEHPVEIRVPVSPAIANQNICAVTLAEDGELSTIYGTKEEKEGQNYFVFRTNHFSAYGIYAGIGKVGEQIKEESNSLLRKDNSPETGEWFNPKWLLIIASVLIGLGLLIELPWRRKQL